MHLQIHKFTNLLTFSENRVIFALNDLDDSEDYDTVSEDHDKVLEDPSRRSAMKAIVATAATAPSLLSASPIELEHQHIEDFNTSLVSAIKEVNRTHPESTEMEKAHMVLNLMATGNFALGISELVKGHAISVGSNEVLYSLLVARYALSDEGGRDHLKKEMVTNAKMTAFVGLMIIAAESFESKGVQERYEETLEKKGEKFTVERKIVLTTLFSSMVSPVTTTLGATGATRDLSHELVEEIAGPDDTEKQERVRALLTGHIANISGLFGFGDPPFLAIVNRFGWKEGMKYQFKITVAPALKSLLDSTHNLLKEVDSEITRSEVLLLLKEAFPFVAKEWMGTMGNIVKNVGSAGLSNGDLDIGVQSFIGKGLKKTGTSFSNLVSGQVSTSREGDEIDFSGDSTERQRFVKELVQMFADLSSSENLTDDSSGILATISKLIDEEEFQKAQELLESADIPNKELLLSALEMEFSKISELESSRVDLSKIWESDELWMVKAYKLASSSLKNTINMERFHEHLGGNLADFANVFPWQIGHGPFLADLLKKGLEDLQGSTIMSKLKETSELSEEVLMDLLSYGFIWGFSSVADNYLGCDLGLKILPKEKAPIAILSSINGGKNTKIGNMANLNLFSMSESDFVDHMKATFKTHFKDDVLTAIYAIVISKLEIFGKVPKNISQHSGNH